MKLRFEVDQAEAFRRGVDCPKSIVSVEIDPSTLDQATRDIIASRMKGIDVCRLDDNRKPMNHDLTSGDPGTPSRIIAALPTLEELIVAVKLDEQRIEGRKVVSQFGKPPPRKLVM